MRFLAPSRPCLLMAIAAWALAPASFMRAADGPTATAVSEADDQQPGGELVARAIEAEAHADLIRRGELLEQALLTAPDLAPARWQSGQVRMGNDWVSVDASIDRASHDDLLVQYRDMRARYGDSKEGQRVLARWCQKHQMLEELRAHGLRVLELSPNDPEAIKLLGLSWHDGVLLTPAELAQRNQAAEHAKTALKTWQPRLMELRQSLDSTSSGEYESALRDLGEIRDPDAIDAIEIAFKGRPALALEIVRVIGQIPGQKATDVLLRRAMLSKREDVRLAACEQLRSRPQHAYVPALLGALSTPLEAKIEMVRDADGVHFVQTVRREGATAVVEKSLDTAVTTLVPNPNLGAIIGEAYTEAQLNAQRTAKTAAKINRKIAEFNGSIYWVLEHTTNQRVPHQPEAWWTWWHDYNVLSLPAKPTVANKSYQNVAVPYVPTIPSDVPIYGVVAYNATNPTKPSATPVLTACQLAHLLADGCFAKGTRVWTLTGQMPIEEIKIGDRVLSQDPATGELAYKPVLNTTLGNQAFIAIAAGDDQIVATQGHQFWVSGQGWRMANQLTVGDRLHTVSGWVEITKLKPIAADETHNLVVADFGTYFVGNDRIFVHDITMLRPTTSLVPGQQER